MNDTQKKLAAMLAGTPTKESEAIRLIVAKSENSKAPTSFLQEQAELEALPSATDLQISKAEAMLGTAKGLPAVSESDLDYFFGENKGQRKPKQQPVNRQLQDDNFTPKPLNKIINEDADRFENANLIADLNKLKKQPIVSPKSITESYSNPDLRQLVENMVYEILSEIVSDANNHLVNKEQIKIQIGESLFVGNLQQALVMPKKK